MNQVINFMCNNGYEVVEIMNPFYQVEFIKDGKHHVRLRGLHFKDMTTRQILEYLDNQFKLLEYQEKQCNPKTIKDLCEEAFQTAKEKGWHDQPRSFGEFISLVHAEVSEALEADRRDEGKERVAEELGDVLIRIFDGAVEFGLDIETAILTKMAYNKTRSYKHGNKKY
jgi:NTP pyrophosphatase (non-canonical NTP hydrolase)